MEYVYESDPELAYQLPIEEWIENRFTMQYASNNNIDYSKIMFLKEKIKRLFNAYGWYVINPPGDGFCGIYVANIADEMSESYAIDYISPIVCPSKDSLFKIIIRGIKSYRATYKQLEIDLLKYINLSIEEIDELLRLEDENRPHLNITDFAINKPIAKMLIGMYRSMNIQYNITIDGGVIILHLDRDFTVNGELKKDTERELKKIKLYGDVDIQILYFLAYAYRHNYIVLQYNTMQQTYPSEQLYEVDELYRLNKDYMCNLIKFNFYEIKFPSDEKDDLAKHTILFDSQSEEAYKSNTTILFNDRHFALIHNINKTVTESLIAEFMKPDGEQLWEGTDALDIQRGFFRVPEPIHNFLTSMGIGRGGKSKRLKRRQLKQHKKTFKYRHRERRSKLLTLKQKKRQKH